MDNLVPSYDKLKKVLARGIHQKIVAFGDSNTTHYSTEAGIIVEEWESYSAMLNVLCAKEPILYGSTIIKRGHPGWMIQGAYENVFSSEVIKEAPGIAIISFGTNDIRNNICLEAFLHCLECMITECIMNDIVPIVFAIPWNETSIEVKLEQWNASIEQICEKSRVSFIDVYTLTRYNPDKYFMERGLTLGNGKRHYNYRASMEIALLLIGVIKAITLQDSFNVGCYQDMWSLDNLSVFKAKSFIPQVNHIQTHSIGDCIDVLGVPIKTSFQTFEIPDKQSITLQAYGKICIGFFPEENVNVIFTGDINESCNIVKSGLLMQRKAFGREGVLTTVTISPCGASCKIRSISTEGFVVKA